jgi:hypothetical protein
MHTAKVTVPQWIDPAYSALIGCLSDKPYRPIGYWWEVKLSLTDEKRGSVVAGRLLTLSRVGNFKRSIDAAGAAVNCIPYAQM